MPRTVARKLDAAFEVASQRLEQQPSCRELFRDLAKDGISSLVETVYRVANIAEERRYCDTAAAFTSVGGRVTGLCRGFAGLSDNGGALILIHEALHHAGLLESPPYPEALSSRKINARVGKSCDL